MHREPSIHVSESNLKKILKGRIPGKIDELVNEILIEARKYSLSNRSLLASNQKLRQKANKLVTSPLEDALLLSTTLHHVRRQMRHRGIEVIKVGHRDWNFMKTISNNANEFCEASGYKEGSKNMGYVDYLQRAIKKLTKYSLPGLQNVHARVMEDMDALERLKSNDEPLYTDRALRAYNGFIIANVGNLLTDYTKEPLEMTYFMDVAYLCRELKITPEIYIKAQFEGLAWKQGIPSPSQLATAKGKERLQTYLFENKIQLVDEGAQEEKINKFKGLKKIK